MYPLSDNRYIQFILPCVSKIKPPVTARMGAANDVVRYFGDAVNERFQRQL
jgi:hypothetical protein